MFEKNKQYSKTLSNNVAHINQQAYISKLYGQPPTQQFMSSKLLTKSASTLKQQLLLDQLVHPILLVNKTYNKASVNQSYTQCKAVQFDQNCKRIRTEEVDQQQFERKEFEQSHNLIEYPNGEEYYDYNKKKLQPTIVPQKSAIKPTYSAIGLVAEERKSQNYTKQKNKSHSPIVNKQTNSMIQALLINTKKYDQKSHPIIDQKSHLRESRNQSADFQMLLKPSQKQAQKNSGQKKKGQSQIIQIDHKYFTQRGSDENKVDQYSKVMNLKSNCKLIQGYQQDLIQSDQLPRKISQDRQLLAQMIHKTPPTIRLTLAQFKEKLSNIRAKVSSEKKQIRSQQSSEPATQKKMPQCIINPYEDSGKCVRTENSYHSSRLSRKSFLQDQETLPLFHLNGKNHEQHHLNPLHRSLEDKLDVMCLEIHSLKRKSDQLEIQNKILFNNLNKIQQERDSQSQERGHVLVKLDQMIDMQRRQEDNLKFFKTIFQTQGISDGFLNPGQQMKTDPTVSYRSSILETFDGAQKNPDYSNRSHQIISSILRQEANQALDRVEEERIEMG